MNWDGLKAGVRQTLHDWGPPTTLIENAHHGPPLYQERQTNHFRDYSEPAQTICGRSAAATGLPALHTVKIVFCRGAPTRMSSPEFKVCSLMAEHGAKRCLAALGLGGGNAAAMIVERD